MSSLLRHQTRSAFIQNHMRLLRRFTHGSIAMKDSNTVTKYVPILKRSLVLRTFHSSQIDYSNCDFSTPCNCSKCMQDQRKLICEICSIHLIIHQSSERFLQSERHTVLQLYLIMWTMLAETWKSVQRERKKAESDFDSVQDESDSYVESCAANSFDEASFYHLCCWQVYDWSQIYTQLHAIIVDNS